MFQTRKKVTYYKGMSFKLGGGKLFPADQYLGKIELFLKSIHKIGFTAPVFAPGVQTINQRNKFSIDNDESVL